MLYLYTLDFVIIYLLRSIQVYCTCAHHDMLRESKICLPQRSHDGDKEHWDNKVFVNDELSSNWNPLCVRLDLDELQPSE